MRIVDFSIRRPVTVVVLFIAIVVFGVVGFDRLSVDLLPDITYPSLNVRTDYEGAAPSEIENLITRPIENAVGVVNNVVRVVSSSRPDLSEVTLEFGWGTDMDMAALDVRERLDVVRLPLDAPRPTLLRFDPSLDPILRFGLTGNEDLVRLRLIAEQEIQRNLERVEGVAAVLVSGGLEEEIHVEIDERKVANLGLSVPGVVNRLGQENVNLTAGRLLDGGTEYLVRTINEFERPEDMRNIVVDAERTVIRLEDVATIRRGAKEREVITRIDGLESIEIAVYKEGGTNTVTVADEVLSRVEGLEERLDQVGEDLALTLVTDQARYIRQSVSEVLQTAVMGGILAIFVLVLFLGELRSTLIIGVSIPISVIGTFFLMYVSGVSLNIMSLGGITLGIGLLVDNSIVVLEAIKRKRQEGMGLVEASQAGTGEVGQAVVASTMTTVCVFVPIVFVEGIAGQLFGDQALTVTFSLAVSLLVALTNTPSASEPWPSGSSPARSTPSPRSARNSSPNSSRASSTWTPSCRRAPTWISTRAASGASRKRPPRSPACGPCTQRWGPAASRAGRRANSERTSASSRWCWTRPWIAPARTRRWRSCARTSRETRISSTSSGARPTSVSGPRWNWRSGASTSPCSNGPPTRRSPGYGRFPGLWT